MTLMLKCKYCKNEGKITCVDDLYYARCSQCNKWPPYQMLGSTIENAIKVWNEYNTIKKKDKKDDTDND